MTGKVSQNLHAELLLRRMGARTGTGSVADGRVAVARLLDGAGLARASYDFSDGSGMSTYNRLTPRAAVRFLRWTQTQPWGIAWRATLPVGGCRRHPCPPLSRDGAGRQDLRQDRHAQRRQWACPAS